MNVDRFRPGLVHVEVERPVVPCGSATRRELRLQPATIHATLPIHLVHARTGALDVSPQ